MNESDAKAVLQAQGIRNPSKALIENWLRVKHYEEAASPPPAPKETVRDVQPCISPSVSLEGTFTVDVTHPSSKSNLEPLLRERGQLERQAGRRRAGRPRVQAPWFAALATLMADGLISLRQALQHLGVHGLSDKEIRALYRNRALTEMRREAHQKWFRTGGVKPSKRRQYGCKGGFPLGMPAHMSRLL